MAQALPTPALRPMVPADGPVLAAIFVDSIDELTDEDYTEGQRAAWASSADDEEAFAEKLGGQLTLVATIGGTPVGFASLADDRHIDMLYVHPNATRRGVATVLVDALEKLASARGATDVTVDASDTARPFFDGRGYTPDRRNTVVVGDEWLGNTTMKKRLATAAEDTAPEGKVQ